MKRTTVVVLSTVLLALFWILAKHVDLYHYALVGAIFELLWLPMLLALVVLPGLSLYFWSREQWRITSLYPYCFLVNLLTIVFLVFYS